MIGHRAHRSFVKTHPSSDAAIPARQRFAAFVACAAALLALVYAGLLVPILTGLLAFSLVHVISARLTGRLAGRRRARGLAALVLAALLLAIVFAAGAALHLALHDGAGVHELLERMGVIVSSARAWLPASIGALLPQSDALFDLAGEWFSSHATELGSMSLDVFAFLGYALVGLLLGTLIALPDPAGRRALGPVSRALVTQLAQLRAKFWAVASAQVKISAVNTTLTALYLLLALPAAGIHLPLSKTLVTLTFVAGLLPIIGNLISNTAITVISVGYSGPVAVASLLFLIGVHKLEYFLNARIVGDEIDARAWEILLSMVILERLLGLPGVVFAPILYAWLKTEWHRWDGPPGAAP